MIGKLSIFGGMEDSGMKPSEGLALYETREANARHDIFFPPALGMTQQPTWQRLRPTFPYIALRYDHSMDRKTLQNTPYKLLNPKTGVWCVGFLVDYGPAESTGRLVDVSPCIAENLDVVTDDEVIVTALVQAS